MAGTHPIPDNPRFKDLTGQRFGRLLVLGYAGVPKPNLGAYWLCRCNCEKATEKTIRGYSLTSGLTRSCGCLARELTVQRLTTHGQAHSKEHYTWARTISKCHNPNCKGYAAYGAKGIKVCDRWRESFEAFLADLGPAPSPKHSLDRHPNQRGNYEPGNVRWATAPQQNRNKRNNHLITFRGETLCLQDWADRLGVKPATLYHRLRAGWPLERALTARGLNPRTYPPFTFIA